MERRRETRVEASRLAAAALRETKALPSALIGFDGFIDSIIDVVDRRERPGPEGYARIASIPAFAARCHAAAGKSTSSEIVVREDRFGGNGPLMAGALAALGVKVDFVGCVGDASGTGIDPVFAPFAQRCEAAGGRIVPIGRPAHTQAFEFDDGKIMFNDPRPLEGVSWDSIEARLGRGTLTRMVQQSGLVGIVNWTNMPVVLEILAGLTWEMIEAAQRGGGVRRERPRVFIDLSDPARRTDREVHGILHALVGVGHHASVTLGLNLAEAERVAMVLGITSASGIVTSGSALCGAAGAIRVKLGLDAVVIHPREGCAAADASGEVWFDGPLCAKPRLSTGAGDHFNAGFGLAQALGLPLLACCAMGCATSGAYVRDAESPSRARLAAFLDALPGPE